MAFANQEHISSSYPSVKFVGKRLLLQTTDETYKKYLNESQFHANGKVSYATFAWYIQKEFLPMNKIPHTEARCETDDNVQFCIDALSNIKMQGISGSWYKLVKETLCEASMSNTCHKFCTRNCYERRCPLCDVAPWKERIMGQNEEILNHMKLIHWLQWKNTGHDVTGKPTTVPQKEWSIGTVCKCFESLSDQLNCATLIQC